MSRIYTTGTGQKIYTHELGECKKGPCPIHAPSLHHMVDWKTHWREDRRILERICEHGIGHPDPDCIYAMRDTVHGCCGCCRRPDERESNP